VNATQLEAEAALADVLLAAVYDAMNAFVTSVVADRLRRITPEEFARWNEQREREECGTETLEEYTDHVGRGVRRPREGHRREAGPERRSAATSEPPRRGALTGEPPSPTRRACAAAAAT